MLSVSSSVFFPYSTVGWSLIVAVVGHTHLILIGSKIPIPYPNLEHFLTYHILLHDYYLPWIPSLHSCLECMRALLVFFHHNIDFADPYLKYQ